MKIDCISDLHGHYPKLEGGDLLIVAGDLTEMSYKDQYQHFFKLLKKAAYEKIIIIGGNHDVTMQLDAQVIPEDPKLTYLFDSGTEFRGLKVWGSPWTARFTGQNPYWTAFTCWADNDLEQKWALIPEDTDILVTHCPPLGVLDKCSYGRVGSKSLFKKVTNSKIKLHVFGHIHENGGQICEFTRTEGLFQGSPVKFVNAALMNEVYYPKNKPVRVQL